MNIEAVIIVNLDMLIYNTSFLYKLKTKLQLFNNISLFILSDQFI